MADLIGASENVLYKYIIGRKGLNSEWKKGLTILFSKNEHTTHISKANL